MGMLDFGVLDAWLAAGEGVDLCVGWVVDQVADDGSTREACTVSAGGYQLRGIRVEWGYLLRRLRWLWAFALGLESEYVIIEGIEN